MFNTIPFYEGEHVQRAGITKLLGIDIHWSAHNDNNDYYYTVKCMRGGGYRVVVLYKMHGKNECVVSLDASRTKLVNEAPSENFFGRSLEIDEDNAGFIRDVCRRVVERLLLKPSRLVSENEQTLRRILREIHPPGFWNASLLMLLRLAISVFVGLPTRRVSIALTCLARTYIILSIYIYIVLLFSFC